MLHDMKTSSRRYRRTEVMAEPIGFPQSPRPGRPPRGTLRDSGFRTSLKRRGNEPDVSVEGSPRRVGVCAPPEGLRRLLTDQMAIPRSTLEPQASVEARNARPPAAQCMS